MVYLMNPPSIPLDALTWEKIGEDDPSDRLLAHIQIGTLNMHLEAWAVEEDVNGLQSAVEGSQRREDFESLCDMMDCSFTTIEIFDREYVLVATPYGD